MDYAKSGGWEIGAVIERHKWVEGMDIGYRRSDIGFGTGSNSSINLGTFCDVYFLPPFSLSIYSQCL